MLRWLTTVGIVAGVLASTSALAAPATGSVAVGAKASASAAPTAKPTAAVAKSKAVAVRKAKPTKKSAKKPVAKRSAAKKTAKQAVKKAAPKVVAKAAPKPELKAPVPPVQVTGPTAPKKTFFFNLAGPKPPAVPLTRREFVEAIDRWVGYYEAVASRSIANPMDGVVMYSDLTGAFKETATGLQRRYRLFDGVDGFRLGIFDANEPITRLQAAKLLANVVTLIERPGLSRSLDIRRPDMYNDLDDNSVEVRDIGMLSSRGIMDGLNGTQFAPNLKLARAQFDDIQANFKNYLDRCRKAL